jgi:hypothetical protein
MADHNFDSFIAVSTSFETSDSLNRQHIPPRVELCHKSKVVPPIGCTCTAHILTHMALTWAGKDSL